MTPLLSQFVETAWDVHTLAGAGALDKLTVRDAAIGILVDMAMEVRT